MTRPEPLSDRVLAIAMTVLVLDLRAPSHRDGTLLHVLVAQWPPYLSFVASFLFTGSSGLTTHPFGRSRPRIAA